MFLAADIGATNARFAFFTLGQDGLTEVDQHACLTSELVASGKQGDPELLAHYVANLASGRRLTGACLACAGPARDGAIMTTGFPLAVDARRIAAALGLADVAIINDLVANTYGLPLLEEREFLAINPGNPDPGGAVAVLSAGTGLGAATAPPGAHEPLPSEGGNAGLSPNSHREDELVSWLRREYGDACGFRALSGAGLVNLYRFTSGTTGAPTAPEIVASALSATCATCQEAVRLFWLIYAGEARNLALRALATGGVFLGGGLTARLAPCLDQTEIRTIFVGTGPFAQLLADIPLKVIRNDRTALLGAARWAARSIPLQTADH